ncbi:MAG: hypothetical protein EXR81_06600 [Gammaproteobacteria bacterium]|nr:hypothetical protein [Gammaproteobacteria bacterium]
MSTIIQNLKKAREAKQFSETDLSGILKLLQDHISNYDVSQTPRWQPDEENDGQASPLHGWRDDQIVLCATSKNGMNG